MIKLMKSTFYKEEETKKKLCDFILSSNKLSMGEKCKEFEIEFSKYQGRKYSVLFNSGSSANLALFQALLNLGIINKGDKIGFSSLTWATNLSPLLQLGLTPIPIDIDLKHLNVSSEKVIQLLSKTDLKVLFLTNLLGLAGDLDYIRKICEEKNICLLEDNCESLGSELNNVKLGNFGFASTFSFFVGHHLSTIEGGMVCTDNEDLYEMLIMARAHGWSRNNSEKIKNYLKEKHKMDDFYDSYAFYYPGYNLRPTEITGFLGLDQLKYLNEMVKKREENFKYFHSIASKNSNFITINASHLNVISSFAYPLLFKSKDDFEYYKNLFLKVVEIRPIVGGSMTEQPFFKNHPTYNSMHSCENSKTAHALGFYLPNNPELNQEELTILSLLLDHKK